MSPDSFNAVSIPKRPGGVNARSFACLHCAWGASLVKEALGAERTCPRFRG
jgi:hypothetical protein